MNGGGVAGQCVGQQDVELSHIRHASNGEPKSRAMIGKEHDHHLVVGNREQIGEFFAGEHFIARASAVRRKPSIAATRRTSIEAINIGNSASIAAEISANGSVGIVCRDSANSP